jgi:hypothetical protein
LDSMLSVAAFPGWTEETLITFKAAQSWMLLL